MQMHPGLTNSGATCYLNSLLQILFFTDSFKEKLFQAASNSSLHPLIKQLVYFIVEMAQGGQKAYSTKSLTQAFNWGNNQIYEQHDAHQFHQVLIEAICRGLKEEQGMNKTFGVREEQFIRCLDCKNETTTPILLRDLALPLYNYQSSTFIQSIHHSLLHLLRPQLLDGDNKYDCLICHKKVPALKGTRILELPEVLVLSLSRCSYDLLSGERRKINSWFQFPQWLGMDQFKGELKFQQKKSQKQNLNKKVTPLDEKESDPQGQFDLFSFVQISELIQQTPLTAQTPVLQPLVVQTPPQGQDVYELYAVLIHVGSPHGGHYTALAKSSSGQWLQLDDQSVRQVQPNSFKKYFGSQQGKSVQSAYTLYYRRRAWRKAEVPRSLSQQLREQMLRRSQQQRVRRQSFVIMVYFKDLKSKLVVPKSKSLQQLLTLSLAEFGLQDDGLRRIRLYDPLEDRGLHTFTGRQKESLQALDIQKFSCMKLEQRRADEAFLLYSSSSIQLKFYPFQQLQLLKHLQKLQFTSVVLDSAQSLSAAFPILGPGRIYQLREGKAVEILQLERRVVFDLGLFSGAELLFEPLGQRLWPDLLENIKDNQQVEVQLQGKALKLICKRTEPILSLLAKALQTQGGELQDYRVLVEGHQTDLFVPVASVINKKVAISSKQQMILLCVWRGTRINCKYLVQPLFRQQVASSVKVYQLLIQRGIQSPFRLRVYEGSRPFQQIPQDFSAGSIKSQLMLQSLPYIDHRPLELIVFFSEDPEFAQLHQLIVSPDSPLEELGFVLQEYSIILPKPLEIAVLLDPEFTPLSSLQFYPLSSKKKVRDLQLRSGMIIFGRPKQPTCKPRVASRAEPVLKISIEQ